MLTRYRIGTKLGSGFAIVSFCVALVAATGIWALNAANGAAVQIGTNNVPSLQGVMMLNLGLADMRRLELAAAETHRTKNMEGFKSNLDDLDRTIKAELEAGWKLYEPLSREPDEDKLWQALAASTNTFRKHIEAVRAELERGAPADSVSIKVADGKALFLNATVLADSLAKMQSDFAEQGVATAAQVSTRGRQFMIIIGAVALLL